MEQQTTGATPQQGQTAAFTAVYIFPTPDGRNYTLEIRGNGDKNGTRIDQLVAQKIVAIDNQMRDPQVQNMLSQSRQNPMGVLQSLMQGMMMPQGFPGMGGGMMSGGNFPPMGGMMR